MSLEPIEQLILVGKLDQALISLSELENQEDISVLLQFSQIYYLKSLYTKSEDFASKALAIANKMKFTQDRIRCIVKLSYPMRGKGNYDDALEHITSAEELFYGNEDLSENKILEAEILDIKALVLMELGQLDKAYDYGIRGLNMRLDLQIESEIEKSYNCLGVIHTNEGNIEQAKNYFQKSLAIREKIGNPRKIAAALMNIATCLYYSGRIDMSIEYNKRVLQLYSESGSNLELAVILNNIGSDYATIGELDLALENFHNSLELYLEIGNKQTIALTYSNIGDIHRLRGNYQVSIDYLKRALILRREIGNDLDIASNLYYFVTIYLEIDERQEAEKFFKELEEISSNSDNKVINIEYKLAKADIIKHTKRMKNKLAAQKLYQEIIEGQVVDQQFTLTAIINFCELLIEELRIYGEVEIIKEIREQIDILIEFGREQQSFIILAEAYLLQSKLTLIEGNIELAKQLLNQAQFMAEEKGLTKLAIKISDEHDILIQNIETWEELIDKNASFSERIDHVNLQDQLHRLLRKSSEEVKIKAESPVSFLVMSGSGLALFSKQFLDSQINENLLSSFISAINEFSKETFQTTGNIERIKHDDYTILVNSHKGLTFCYVFVGQSYSAKQKLGTAILRLQENRIIWQEITKTFPGMDQTILDQIELIVNDTFL